jgi:transcription-repair coupling factor (superfamily II helicase)
LRIEFFGEEIERITRFEPLTGNKIETLDAVVVFPAKQFVTTNDKMKRAILTIREELGTRIMEFERDRQTARSPAHQAAHGIRPGNDGGNGRLLRHRKLFAPHFRPSARLAAEHAL